MIETVVKRTGKKAKYNRLKIEKAIFEAIINCEGKTTEELAKEQSVFVANVVEFKLAGMNKEIVSLEEIQNTVEESLMLLGMNNVARGYIRYRAQREDMRNDKIAAKAVEKIMDNYITKDDWLVKENSNMDYSLQGLNTYISGEITKSFYLNHVFSKEQGKAHKNGDIHIHDLTSLSTYCCGWDLEKLLLVGFTGVKRKISSKPAKHLRSALGQLCNFLFTLQGEAAGAQAISSFDTYLAPFVRYDNLDYAQVKQIIQEFIFNLNVPTRVGFQTPFTNITLDLNVPSTLKDNPVIIGGTLMEEKYSDFQIEMNMINKAFAEVMSEGDANGRIFTFPIPTYNITKDFDWDNEIVNDIMKMTSKYGTPYFCNFVNSDMNPEDVRSMCCRLRLDNRELRKRGGGLFGANPLTGSIGIITLNLPRLGYLYKDKEVLKDNLARLLDMCKNVLDTKRKMIEQNTKGGLYPYSRFYLKDVYDRFGEYWKNHFNTIGIIGMNECVLNFTDGKDDITSKYGQEFSIELMDFINEKLTEFQEDGSLYNLEATPGEGTTYRFAKRDKELYSDIITAGDKEPYYTNSTQLPVGHSEDLFEVLNLQDELQSRYTGGTVLHGYIGEQIDDPETTKNLIKNIFENYKLPYFSITPTFSICQDHGYIKGEHFNCPECGSTTEVWTRVVGFYRPMQSFNKGKTEEYHERVCFKV